MAKQMPQWIRVAALGEVPPGEAKAVTLGDGRSVALFNVQGRVYATDNQCPHMGYPLTRGAVREGILTCDWHGRSFDLEGGGCFNSECDDLQTFPVEVRREEIWIQPGDARYRRREEHLRLLRQGLLSGDRWTISKAIALLLRGGVPEEDVVELVLQHLGRHAAGSHGPEGGRDVARLINGLRVAQRYRGADRLMALTTAASAAAGGAAERLDVVPLPEPVSLDDIERWTRMFSHDGEAGRIERCLYTAWRKGRGDRILPLLYECAVEPHFLGFPDNLLSLGYLAEAAESFGWEKSSELVFNLGAKLVGRRREEPERFRRDAVSIMASAVADIDASDPGANRLTDYDEDALVRALSSANIERSFEAVRGALQAGVAPDRLITTFVLLAADRMARTPVNVDAGWPSLTTELTLSASLRRALRHGGARAAAKGLFHAAWQMFADRWLNIPFRPLSEPHGSEAPDLSDEEEAAARILGSIAALDVQEVERQVPAYLNAGHSGSRLLHDVGRAMLWDDTNSVVLPALRTVLDEWEHCAGHPAAGRLPAALARYATDIRMNRDSSSAIITAMRFAEGKTTVEVFEG